MGLQLYLYNYGRAKDYMSIESYAILLVGCCVLFYLFIFDVLKFFSNKIMNFLGEISYTLYLLHQALIYGFIIPLFVDEYSYDFWTVTLVLAIPLSILLATGFTYLIDIPVRNYLRQRLCFNLKPPNEF